MLTLFTIPKPFRGHIAIIQRNAIQSWLKIHPGCEVILFGDEYDVDKVAAELRIRHIPDIKRNEYGTPLLNAAFDFAQQVSTHKFMCYINADIILLSDFLKAVQQFHKNKGGFLLVGRRWDIDLDETYDFDKPDWETKLRAYVAEVGTLHPGGIDYFVFPRGQYRNMPPFAVGRPAWDNWMIYRTRFLHIPVVDGTEAVTAIHQNHGYEHVPYSVGGSFNGPEGKRNLELAGGRQHVFTIQDATSILTSQGLRKPKLTANHLYRQLDTLPELYPRLRFIAGYRYLIHLGAAAYVKVMKLVGIK